jgi:phosphoadenosine phosphosulfate reductase
MVRMLVERTLYGDRDKVAVAVARVREFAPAAERVSGGIQVCVSGGKDSAVIQELCVMAGVKCAFVHAHTSADHPETVRFVRRERERMREAGYEFSIDTPRYEDGRQKTMWNLIEKCGFPTRTARWCCAHLKEFSGEGKCVVTGVRWAESARRRKTRGVCEALAEKVADKVVLNNDNDIRRRLAEICVRQRKYVLNPIVDWSDGDVWEFIAERNLPVNPLYARGYKRVGCVGCPLNRRGAEDLERLPKYKAAYMRAGGCHLEYRKSRGLPTSWKTAEEYYAWWKYGRKDDGGRSLFEGDGGKERPEADKQMRLFAAVMEGRGKNGELAEAFGVSVSTVEHAAVVRRRASGGIVGAVLAGRMSVNQAYERVRRCGV